MAQKKQSTRAGTPKRATLAKGKRPPAARRAPSKAEVNKAGLSLTDVRDIKRIKKTEGPEVAFRFMKYKQAHNHGMKQFGFDAIKASSKRRTPLNSVGSLDSEFNGIGDRTKMIATARDITQNFSMAKGLISIDVNNVVGAGPKMQVRTRDLEWNARKEAYFNRWGLTCDIRGVMWFGQFIRTIQRRMVVDGDNGTILTNTGQLQGIEGDRIDNPPKDRRKKNCQYVDGVENDENLRPLAYGVWKRGSNRTTKEFQDMIPKRNFVHAFDPERFDQSRGISHIISAINDLQDTREILEAVKGSMKLENILGLVFHTDLPNSSTVDPLGLFTDYTATDSLGDDQTRQEVKIGQGAWSLNLLPGEDVKAVQKQTPGGNFDSMMLFEIRLAGLALDMPLEVAFMYFSRGSFSSLRGALRQYHAVVLIKRKRLEVQICNRIANWITERGIKRWNNGDHVKGLEPPSDSSIDPRTQTWQWPGLPLLDPDKERKSQVIGYNLASLSVSDICTPEGRDWQDVTDQRIRELVYMKAAAEKANIPPEWVLPAVLAPGQSAPGAGEPAVGSAEDMSAFEDRIDEAVEEALARLRE